MIITIIAAVCAAVSLLLNLDTVRRERRMTKQLGDLCGPCRTLTAKYPNARVVKATRWTKDE